MIPVAVEIYKYCSPYGLGIVRDLELKVTPPIQFNDPFEFSPYLGVPTNSEHIRHLLRTTPRSEIYQEMKSAGAFAGDFDEFEKSLRIVEPSLIEHGSPAYDIGYRELVNAELQRVSERNGVISLTENENNPLMWSHYTDSHKGMVIGFDTKHEYFQINSRFLKVEYSKCRVPFDPNVEPGSRLESEFAEKVLLTKQECWSYEQEWRSLYPLDWCEKRSHGGQMIYFTRIPQEIVKVVVLGCRASVELADSVKEARKRNGISFVLLKAEPHESEFRLEYRKV